MPEAPTQQDRLAAAARILAAAEESARGAASPSATTTPGSGSAPGSRRTPGPRRTPESASERAARRWVDRVAEPDGSATDGPVATLNRLDLDGGGTAADPEAAARQIVLKQLTLGPRTRKQLADKLRERDCDDALAARVLDRMTDVGLIDDQAFAEMLVRSKQAGRGLAKRALAQELRQKGVDDETVSQALGSIDPESERARAEQLAAKKMRTMGGLDPQVQSRRLSGVLARKGYPLSVVYAVVREVVNGAPEHQRD